MGWYSTPFNYDGTSPTQVRDDLQKANENFQALSDVFENGTPLSGRIKSSYIPDGGGGSVSGNITVNSVKVSNPNRVNFGVDLSPNASGFYQAAIKMPVGVPGSAIQWQPTSGDWGVGESKIGVDTAGNFMIIGRYNSSGKRVINLHDDVNVSGQLTPISIRLAPQANQNSLIDLRSGATDCSGAYILMPTGGVSGNFISWGDPPHDNTLIGILSSNRFVIFGRADAAYGGRRTIYMYDDTIVTGNAYISGNLTVSGTISGNISLPSTPTFQHIDIQTTPSDTYGLNFRNGYNNFTGSACILMPTSGNGNKISWGDPDRDSTIGLSSSGLFFIFGAGSTTRTVFLYDDLRVAGTIYQGSDISMKENIELFSDSALNLVKSIDVYKYLFKVDQKEHVGFIANYVKDVFPMGVTVSEEDDKCSINILDMLALLFKAVKELISHVEDLKGNI